MSNNNDEEKKDFTINQQNDAYLELCFIIRTVIENGDFASLEPMIALWESKYPLARFTDQEIIRKIKTILNKDYLSRLVGDYLASQVLHEQQKQQEFYENLRKIINTAKKQNTKKGYENAKKEVAKWKTSLYENGFSIFDFNKNYSREIFKMLLMPSKKLAEIEEASDSLKKLMQYSTEMKSEELSLEISSWKDKYSIDTFPDDLKKELNSIAGDILQSISTKRDEETAIQEMQEYLATVESKSQTSPAEEIPKILSKYDYSDFSEDVKSQILLLTTEAMSLIELALDKTETVINVSTNSNYIPPVQKEALYDLRTIFDKNSRDINGLFNWIYINRKINFVPSAVEEIKAMFSMAGFSKPLSGEYSIPSLGENTNNLNVKEVTNIKEKVVLNFLGILYTDNKSLSNVAKDNIANIKSTSIVEDLIKPKTTIVLQAEDNEQVADTDSEEEINIFIEDILNDPLESYNISNGRNEYSTLEDSSDSLVTKKGVIDNAGNLNIDDPFEQHSGSLETNTSNYEQDSSILFIEPSSSSVTSSTIKDMEDNSYYTTNLLNSNDIENLEGINYMIIGSTLHSKHSKLNAKKFDIQKEKNNG